MYAAYFGLAREPFSIAPDPRYLFMSERHREALAHLVYGVQGGGGFVLLTGEVGAGKTTVCRSFLEQVPAATNVAYIFNPKLTVLELLQSVCEEFRIEPPPATGAQPRTVKDWIDPLNAFLLRAHAAGQNNVLVIDEAQNLSAEVLEQLRLLTNLETSERKLLQIILIGQPELRELLARPGLEQLAQRVIARFHLGPLTEVETAQYVRHRLEVAGLSRPLPFDARALRRVWRHSGGVPRRINLLCDRALLGAFAEGAPAANRTIVDKAAAEVFGETPRRMPRAPWAVALAVALLLAVGVAALVAWRTGGGADARAVGGAVAAAASPQATAGAAPAVAPALTSGAAPVAAAQPASAAAGAPGAAGTAALPAGAFPPVQPAAVGRAPVLHTSLDAAWRELAPAWGVQAPEAGDVCAALVRQQVMCHRASMGLALVRQLARPGIVALDAGSTSPTFALLVALGEGSATLRAGGTEQTVTLAALAARWNGEFATLWRMPPGHPVRPLAVDQGPALAWAALQPALRATDGAEPPARIDKALAARLRAFQLAQGLPVTGTLGPLTFMQLNRAAGVAEPRLRTPD